MVKIIGALPGASQTALDFIGGLMPQDDAWKLYIIKALPTGLILQRDTLFWQTTGAGVVRCEKPAELVTTPCL